MRVGIALIGLLLASAGRAAGAETIELDLADAGGKMIVAPGTEVTFKVLHRLPGASYRYKAERIGLLAPLGLALLAEFELEAPPQLSEACRALLDGVRHAGEGSSERALRAALLDALARSPDDCTSRIRLYEAGTEVTLANKVTIGEGQTVVVVITRLQPEGADRWRFEIGTGEDRRWLIHYGFAFLPDEDEEFFTRQVAADGENGGEGGDGENGGEGGDGGGFTILPANDRGGADFEPTITFTYLPRTLARSPWVPKFTAGLGADLEEQLVFAGLSWVIGDNVNLFVGAAGHEQTRLKGIYEDDQVVQESLTGDQLVDETFELNVIFGVGFRFDRNPFKKADPPAATNGGDQDSEPDEPGDEPGSRGEDDSDDDQDDDDQDDDDQDEEQEEDSDDDQDDDDQDDDDGTTR